mgnify:CR=1 FL=1
MGASGRIGFSRLEAVIYGQPVAEAVTAEVERMGLDRVFLLTSGTLNRETDEVSKLCLALGDRVVGIYAEMAPHTPRGKVIEVAAAARAANAQLIVTFGGGSVTDAAKAVCLCLANDIYDVAGMDILRAQIGADGKALPPAFIGPMVKQISIPTTLSAGEFSAIAGVTDESNDTKELFGHPDIVPKVVILDPEPTQHTPEWLFLSTGIRAVDHCVEGVCSKEANPYGDAQALKGLSLLVQGLMRVKADPADLDARLEAQIGAWMSMGPISSGVPMGASHGIGYVLGAAFGIPHGHTSCIMLPAVMRWNKSVNADRQQMISDVMGNIAGVGSTDAADKLDAFIAGIGMPRTLSSVDIKAEHFQMIAEGAMNTPWVPRNPRPITGPDDVIEILKLAA